MIHRLIKQFALLALLLSLPVISQAFDRSQWDCKLKKDGVTWDCGISSKPLIKKEKIQPELETAQSKPEITEPPTETNNAVQTTLTEQAETPARLSRVRLNKVSTQPLRSVPLKKANISTAKNSEWNCVIGLNNTWDCSKPGVTNVAKNTVEQAAQPVAPVISRVKLNRQQTSQPTTTTQAAANNSDWNCLAGQNGNWDCTRTASTQINAVVPEDITSNNIQIAGNQRADDKILFEQMVQQLTENPWDTCQVATADLTGERAAIELARLNAKLHASANYTEIQDKNNANFIGDVALERADQFLTADQVNYNSKENSAFASGDVFYQEHGFALHSQEARLQLANNTGQFSSSRFILEGTHARGTADSIALLSDDLSQSRNITYTTCAPDSSEWLLQAKSLELNNKTGRGTARNVWLEMFDMPVFYTPYITFPIDDRRMSGFLAPTFGSSDTTGTDFSIPYYWNIAANYDATITPRLMSDRGIMIGGEFRHLSSTSEGQVAVEVLNDIDLDELRGQFSLQNKTSFTARLNSDIDINFLSDDDYLEDFGNSLVSSSSRYIKSYAKINYRADSWNLLANIDNYDSIDEGVSSISRPHRRLPQLQFSLNSIEIADNTHLDMRNEFVYFDHSAIVRGKRLDLKPSISHTYRTPGSFISPKLTLSHTDYRLDNQTNGVNGHQSRTLPILSVDSGLFFERDINFGNGLTQTLEPRAYYLYVPHENQDDIPLFDTSEYDFSFNQLFRDNRFSGSDRIADANQLSLAVTTRFIEQETGRERLRASIGTIVYLDDSKVTLNPSDTAANENTSDIVGELSSKFTDHWSVRSALQYNPHNSKTEKATLGFHYRDGPNKLFNASYRSRYAGTTDSNGNSNDIEQTDVSFKWPISKSWSTVGRWNYSEEQNLTLESFIGLEKDTCCWRLKVLARRYVNDAFDEEPKQGLFFQLELKGLTSLGKKVEPVLEEGILGYTPAEK